MNQTRPSGVLLCDPLYFDIVDVKNPFMSGAEPVDKVRARLQWQAVAEAFRAAGAGVLVMPGSAGCEDMVFCANTTLTGIDSHGTKRALGSQMTFRSRQREVESAVNTLKFLGYGEHNLPEDMRLEGGGDGVWHTGHHRLFAGHGYRSEPSAYAVVEKIFGCEIVPLSLRDPRFYHLDTCLCVIDERTALIYPPAFTGDSYRALRKHFPRVIEVDENEAMNFACNACSIQGSIIIEQSAKRTVHELRNLGFNVFPVDTSEFMKSGGSVYCMKQYLF